MFGYVLINKPEMKFREYDEYHSFYCGLCKTLQKRHGFFARLTVNYDLTFLSLLLSSLYEPQYSHTCKGCIVHPFRKICARNDRYMEYCSDMNVYLTWLKCIDDWKDDKKIFRGLYALLLMSKARKIEGIYPEKTKTIINCMNKLSSYENEKSTDLDLVAGAFGEIMEVLFSVEEDTWNASLRQMGFFLGKFIYLMDAYEDLEDDKKKNRYNPLMEIEKRTDYEVYMQNVLKSMMAECCRAFEYLPIVENVEILRNILYAGVWTKYHEIRKNKENKKNKKNK